jgi:integrase/recombinase XerD
MKYLTSDEIGRLFAVIESVRDLAAFRVAYHRGLRASEVGMLQLADWQRSRGRLTVRRLKGSNGGEYMLCKAETRALTAWLKERGDAPGPLFTSRNSDSTGTGITRKRLDALMRRYGAAAGLPEDKWHMHVLKHSCATHLLSELEQDVAVVQDWLGHADIRNTMVYAQITNSRRDAVARATVNW